MRIALVSEHASPLAVLGGVDAGGQNVHVAELAQGLAKLGDEVVVYTRRDDRSLRDRVRVGPRVVVEHVSAGPPAPVGKDELLPYMDDFAAVLARRWRAEPPDLVHAHFWMSGKAALAAAGPQLPVVQTFHALGVVKRRHQGSADTSPLERLPTERTILATCDHVIATCSDEVFELARLGAALHRVSVVPCGVDLEHFRPDGPAEPRGPRPRLVILSRLVRRKGIGTAIEALAEIPEAELVIAGGPAPAELDAEPEVYRLRDVAERAGVADRVVFRGRVDRADVPALLRSSDVVLCAPWYEPFGIVPLEAMACGRPVVASAVGGLVDSVVDGATGLLVPPRDPERIAEAVRTLLGDEPLRRRLGAAGVPRARRRFGWPRVTAATRRVYLRVLGRVLAGAGSRRQ